MTGPLEEFASLVPIFICPLEVEHSSILLDRPATPGNTNNRFQSCPFWSICKEVSNVIRIGQ